MNPKNTYHETLANTIIKNMEKRQIEACYCKTKEEAVAKAESYLTKDSVVSFGGSVTLTESGMMDALKSNPDITLLDRDLAKTPEERTEILHKAEELLLEDMPVMPVIFTQDAYLVNTKQLSGIKETYLGYRDFRGMTQKDYDKYKMEHATSDVE